MVALKRFRSTGPSFADLVPYAGLIDNGVMLLKDGSLMAGWYFAGPDSESATDQERNELSRQINAILSRLGSGWIIQVEAVRVPTVDYPEVERSHFPDAVSAAIEAERRAHFAREKGHFESKHAIILTYRPLESKRSSISKYIYSDEESRKRSYADTVLFLFKNTIREIEQYLASTLSIRRMQTNETFERGGERRARYDELLQFIRFCITGENHPVRLPEIPMRPRWQSQRPGTVGPHLARPKHREGRRGETFLSREEWRRPGVPARPVERGGFRQGMKVSEHRCGNKSEAKPFFGQTCRIEPANGALSSRERNKAMAADNTLPRFNDVPDRPDR